MQALKVEDLAAVIASRQSRIAGYRSLLVGVSGIDGSGKGYVSARLAEALCRRRIHAAVINVDPWLRLPAERFDARRPAEHFYERGLRLEEMFEDVVLPLKARRSVDVTIDAADATNASTYHPLRFEYDKVDVIILDGIFLFKRELRHWLDVSIWVDCSFETALDRALRRNQENLPPELIVRDYHSIYFPAQRIHFMRDNPQSFAELVICNDVAWSAAAS